MTQFIALTLCSIFSADMATMRPLLTLEPVPEDSEAFLSLPMDMTIDDAGRFYISDANAKTVFVWEKDGSFLGNFGKEGAGPGEFQFNGIGGPQAYLSTVGDTIFVYDGAKRSVNLFSPDLKFQTSTTFQLQGGRTNYFKVTPDKNYLVYHQTFRSNPPVKGISVFGPKGERLRDLKEIEDKSFSREGDGNGRPSAIVINGYSATMVVHYEPVTGEVIIGDSGTPTFEVYTLDGKLKKSVRCKIPQQEVSQADKDEFNEQPWIKGNSFFKTAFPEKKAFYTNILPLKDKGFIVYNQSPFYGKVDGLWVDRDGNSKAVIKYNVGENGQLFSIRGRLLSTRTDEYGDFEIHELSIN